MSDIKGRYLWYELMTTDVDAAAAFYGEVVGWKTQSWEGGTMPYTMFMAGEEAIGGLMKLPEEAQRMGAPAHWLAYVGVPDVDEAVAKLTELDGTVLAGPLDIPQVGRIAVFKDPQGAAIAAFTPAGEPMGHDGDRQLGEFSWNELGTTDYPAAFTFYEAIFGWDKIDDMDMGEMGIYRIYGKGERSFGGMFDNSPDMPKPTGPFWLHYVKVDDCNSAVERVKANGGQVLNGPMEVPGGDLIAQCMDPQGVAFALHSSAE
jgi:predicted enzyme related to lactoylglutathione lyase